LGHDFFARAVLLANTCLPIPALGAERISQTRYLFTQPGPGL
jgi:hypothetical protein